jgi:hypothetical protein
LHSGVRGRKGRSILPEAIFIVLDLATDGTDFDVRERRLLSSLDNQIGDQGEGKKPGLITMVLKEFTIIIGPTGMVH